ncbi:MAG: M67 family metallopeptidase [Anaerolineales bacterium]|nr:M67 family metallopeptidase [Anaerolineales bacterium]
MSLRISQSLIEGIERHVEAAYPEEGAGFLLGADGAVTEIIPLPNAREDAARHNRFLFTPQDYMNAETRAIDLGADLLGVFHSHPDCPNVPSEYDREWAQPFFSYIITRVDGGKAVSHRSWRLKENREGYDEEEVVVG